MNRNKSLKNGGSSINYNLWLLFLHSFTTAQSGTTSRMQPVIMAPAYRTSEWRTGVVLLSMFLAAATSGQSSVAAFSFSGVPTRVSPSTTAAGRRKTSSAQREGPHPSSSRNSRAAVKRGRHEASGWYNSLSLRLDSPDAQSTR